MNKLCYGILYLIVKFLVGLIRNTNIIIKVEDLLEELKSRKEGRLFKIHVKFHSEDPRIKLREDTSFSESDYKQIQLKLERLDKYSKAGDWTLKVLQVIKDHPALRAADLAAKIGMEKDWLKLNVRKLKNMGLTISLGVGYKLSARGEKVLTKLKETK